MSLALRRGAGAASRSRLCDRHAVGSTHPADSIGSIDLVASIDSIDAADSVASVDSYSSCCTVNLLDKVGLPLPRVPCDLK